LAALAGGGPENAVLIVDPRSDDAKHVANYYRASRNIPDRNVIYMAPDADSYAEWVAFQLPALRGMLANRAIQDHVDYIILPPGGRYSVPAAGLVFDPCWVVNDFSITGAYTMAPIAESILLGDVVSRRNHYAASTNAAIAFDAGMGWREGSPDPRSAERYFIAAMLGYSGPRGNTIDDTVAMIERSVAADGTRPAGTFYYMRTTDQARSAPRHDAYPVAVASLANFGGQAEELAAVLPEGRHDCLGIMTGWAGPDINGTDMTILPGAFCDHLTSFAAAFGTASQTKVSAWIAKGASGSWGAVQEPCNYAGKFPHAGVHVYYYQGLSLGEAVFRSVAFVPFQMLLYGDPLTRPFADIPVVSVPDAPTIPVSGVIELTPSATGGRPGFAVGLFELLIDGAVHSAVPIGGRFVVDTAELADGWHDVRVIGYEASPIATQGRWVGSIEVNNRGYTTQLTVSPGAVNPSGTFDVDVSATGGAVREIRLRHNHRVIAATQQATDSFTVPNRVLGAGSVSLSTVAEFDGGTLAYSKPADMGIVTAESVLRPLFGNSPPVAYDYTADVPANEPFLLDLPALDPDGDALSYSIIDGPGQATMATGGGAALLRPSLDARGTDMVTFVADDGLNKSNEATVRVRYGGCGAVGLNAGRVEVDLELEGVRYAVTRELMLQLSGCGTVDHRRAPVTVEVSGRGWIVLEDVPECVTWLTVQEGHTLRRRVEVVFDACAVARIDLTGSRRLRAGDLETDTVAQDNVVDIVDYAIVASLWGETADPNSVYGGDIDGDGTCGEADLAITLKNQRASGDPAEVNPNGGAVDRSVSRTQRDATGGRRRVAVSSLPLANVARADVNGDGVLDDRDVRAFVRKYVSP